MPGEKSEKPTQRRLLKAREEGRFPASREFVSAIQFLVFVWLLSAFGLDWFESLKNSTRLLLKMAFETELTRQSVIHETVAYIGGIFKGPLVAGSALLAVTIAAQLVTTGLGVSFSRLAPSFSRLNPASRIKELPRQNLPVFFQSIILLPLFSYAVWALGSENWDLFRRLPLSAIEPSAQAVCAVLETLLWRAGALFLIFGLVDLVRQKRRHQEDLKMSHQEIREEFKETEGNPLIKQRVRRLQRDLARRNMMKEIPTATAVVVNPTHFAVAIRYSLDEPGAPRVVAKGKNYLALRIKARAIEHNVPIIENPPLAQALYKSVDVGQEIPADLYRAVAEVLAYIFRLMNGRLPGSS